MVEAFYGVGKDFVVVKGEANVTAGYFGNGDVFGVTGVAATLGLGEVMSDSPVGHGDHALAGVAVWFAVGAELFEMADFFADAGFFGEFSTGRLFKVFVGEYKAAGERPFAKKGGLVALDEQYAQRLVDDAENYEVYGDPKGGVLAGVMRRICHV